MGKVIHAPKQTSIYVWPTQSPVTQCENGCVFAKTKPQSIITTALQEVKK